MAQPQQKPEWAYGTDINYYHQPSYNLQYNNPVRCNETCCQTVRCPAPRRPYHDSQYSQQPENAKPLYSVRQFSSKYMPVNHHYWSPVSYPQYPQIHRPVVQPNPTKEYYNFNRYRFQPYNNPGIQNNVRPLKSPTYVQTKKVQQLDVRQFLATWREKDDEPNEHTDNTLQQESGQFYPAIDTFQPLDYTVRNGNHVTVNLEDRYRDSDLYRQKCYGPYRNNFCSSSMQSVNYDLISTKTFPETHSLHMKQHTSNNNLMDTRKHLDSVNQYNTQINIRPPSVISNRSDFESPKQYKPYNKSWVGASCERKIEKISNPMRYHESPEQVELSHTENFNMNRECRINSGNFPGNNNPVETNFDDFKMVSEKYTLTVCLETDELFDDINKKKEERQKLVVHPLRHDDYDRSDLSSQKLPELPVKPILQSILSEEETCVAVPGSGIAQSTISEISHWDEAHLNLQNSNDNMDSKHKTTEDGARQDLQTSKYLLNLSPDEIIDYEHEGKPNTLNLKKDELLGFKESLLSNGLSNDENNDISDPKCVIDCNVHPHDTNNSKISSNALSFNDFDSNKTLNTFDCSQSKDTISLSIQDYNKSTTVVSLSSEDIDVSIASCVDITVPPNTHSPDARNCPSSIPETIYNDLDNCKPFIDSNKVNMLTENNSFSHEYAVKESAAVCLSEKSDFLPSPLQMEPKNLDTSSSSDMTSLMKTKTITSLQKSTSCDTNTEINPTKVNYILNQNGNDQVPSNWLDEKNQPTSYQENISLDKGVNCGKELAGGNEIKNALESIAYFYEDINCSESSEDTLFNLRPNCIQRKNDLIKKEESEVLQNLSEVLNVNHYSVKISNTKQCSYNNVIRGCDYNQLNNFNPHKHLKRRNSSDFKKYLHKILMGDGKLEQKLNKNKLYDQGHAMVREEPGIAMDNELNVPDCKIPLFTQCKPQDDLLLHSDEDDSKMKPFKVNSALKSAKYYAARKIVIKYTNMRCQLNSKRNVPINRIFPENILEQTSVRTDSTITFNEGNRLLQENKADSRDGSTCCIDSNFNYACCKNEDDVNRCHNNNNVVTNEGVVTNVHSWPYLEEEVKAVPESVNLKCSLRWDKIFNAKGKKSETELNLGPAKVEVRLGPNKGLGQWRIIDNCKDTHSQVLKVKRLIMQRKTLPKERVPKVIIKKTEGEEYKSYIKESGLLQPAVMLERCSQLDELAKETVHTYTFNCKLCSFSSTSQEKLEEHQCQKEAHHCLLCQRSFPTLSSFYFHEETRSHKHLEIIQKNAAHNIHRLLTGLDCPLLAPMSTVDRDHLKWKPNYPGFTHYYHHATI